MFDACVKFLFPLPVQGGATLTKMDSPGCAATAAGGLAATVLLGLMCRRSCGMVTGNRKVAFECGSLCLRYHRNKQIPVDKRGPSFRLWNTSPVLFLFSVSLYSSAGLGLKPAAQYPDVRSKMHVPMRSPGSAGRYWKSTGSLTSRSDGRRSCIFTLMGSEMLASRYGGVRNTMATCLCTSACEKVPFPSHESWKKRTSMSSAGRQEQAGGGEHLSATKILAAALLMEEKPQHLDPTISEGPGSRLGRLGRSGASPFWTLSHSRKISSPPLQLPELRLTLQIFSSAVFGAPAGDKRAHLLIIQHPGRSPSGAHTFWAAGATSHGLFPALWRSLDLNPFVRQFGGKCLIFG